MFGFHSSLKRPLPLSVFWYYPQVPHSIQKTSKILADSTSALYLGMHTTTSVSTSKFDFLTCTPFWLGTRNDHMQIIRKANGQKYLRKSIFQEMFFLVFLATSYHILEFLLTCWLFVSRNLWCILELHPAVLFEALWPRIWLCQTHDCRSRTRD